MPNSCMFSAHFSHLHIVGQKTVQNNFSKADELLLTGVKNGEENDIMDPVNSCTVLPSV